jgi:hypothetical protein
MILPARTWNDTVMFHGSTCLDTRVTLRKIPLS